MSLEFEIPAVSLVFISLLCFFYFSKPRIDLTENKFYSYIIIFSLLESFFSLIAHTISSFTTFETLNTDYYQLINIINRFVTTFFVAIFICFFIYVLIISYEKNRNREKMLKVFTIVFVIVFFFITSFTNINIVQIGNVTNIRGSTITMGYILVFIMLILSLVTALINIKKMDIRYLPIFIIMPILVLLYFLTIFLPGIILYDFSLALLCYIMYFTIENPDVKMISQLELAINTAQKANQAKSDFLSSMSHEIRTPLNAIVGLSYINMEYKDQLPKEVQRNTELILSSSNTLLDIVGNVLDMNKIDSHSLELVETPYNFVEEIKKMALATTSRIENNKVKFKMSFAKDIPNELIGDKARIKQIINNLLTNSIKYTAKGSINLDVHCINKTRICNLIISVKDTGKGIKKEDIDKLFTKFERLDAPVNSTISGTGLGLAITKSLVDMMGGKINVQSIHGKGSTFIVRISQKISKEKNK